jgi:SAM-dependent methyltransferase
VLTVDFERLGVEPGHRLLDLGCGGGRHAFEALRRGATVIALDYAFDELRDVRAVMGAMQDAGEIPASTSGGAVNGDALALPFPDDTFDRIIASEVLEHIWADELAISELVRVLRPRGRLAVTVPAELPEKLCWALDADYHDTPSGHIRIYKQRDLEEKLRRGGVELHGAHRAHALHSPYWWVKCAVGVDNEGAWPVRKYRALLEWQIVEQPEWLGSVDRALNPVLGKSLVVYTEKAPA